MTDTITKALPPIVSREEWQVARDGLLEKEKAYTRAGDALAAERRRLPMVEITEPYVFTGEHGAARLIDLFEGRSQLIVYHFMFAPDWDEGCDGCSMLADHIGPLVHLHARDTTYALVSRAPIGKLLAFRDRMGWELPWFSSGDTTFNEDFHATVNGHEHHGISAFLRDGDRIFHTWSTYNRGVESVVGLFDLLDFTPYGRQETWEDSPEGWPQTEPYAWWRHHDRYEEESGAGSCH
jgi:predicted dithiol-disulfide oxidoreductase (DUF899 family)